MSKIAVSGGLPDDLVDLDGEPKAPAITPAHHRLSVRP